MTDHKYVQMHRIISLIIFLQVVFSLPSAGLPDEGMWIPMLIEKYNIKLMQEMGFRLSAEDIYSVNKACMKDAVVIFGGGCTGELISPDGLLLTNHHCGYGTIQRLSSIENDYLTHGYWAMSRPQELQCPGLFVTFLKKMEDVTEKVLDGIDEATDDETREKLLRSNSDEISRKAVEGSHFTASIRPFYMGNQYFLFVYETFRDIRFVGAPPSSIGKFGGETDNWTWPRHTGDFSLFRIYAGKDNKPADYSATNAPYKPGYYFPISLRGVNEGDFTMVFGYPGSTYQYVPSYHIDMIKNYLNPKMIAIRSGKIEIMEAAMNSDPSVRLKYSVKKSGIANSWKKWIGENQGLERMKTIEKKKEYEENITRWIDEDEKRKAKYGDILPRYKELYSGLKEYMLVNNVTNEVFFNRGAEATGLARNMISLAGMYENNSDPVRTEFVRNEIISEAKEFFKDYDPETDRKLFAALMQMYGEFLESSWHTPEYIRIKNECSGDFRSLADKVYRKSVFTDERKFMSFVKGFTKTGLKKLGRDPVYTLSKSAVKLISENVKSELDSLSNEIRKLNRIYMEVQMEYDKDRVFYPDANSTLRVAYGTVKGYYSRDAVYFKHYTTLEGIMDKDNPEIFDYDVPDRLKQLYSVKDYGRYAHEGTIPVCFIADNHTSGGNSGSPVINANGHLIGINFDRAWEGVASDLVFNTDQSRNISLDIRFVLFIIDKYAGAGYLLDEMTIID